MYRQIIRPLLFKLSPESVHNLTVGMMKFTRMIPGCGYLIRSLFLHRSPQLEREVFGIKFPNPIGLAAGFDKNAEVYEQMANFGFGFVEIGTVTPKPQPGNTKPRLFRLTDDNAIINRMGFNNLGLANAVKNLRSRDNKIIIGGNLGKNTLTSNENAAADYLKLFRCMYEYVDYFVVNVSCPNIAKMSCLQDKDNLIEILSGLLDFRRGQNQYRPILLKISPDLTQAQVDDSIAVLIESGLDGIVATNTTTSREGLKSDPKLVESIANGGLSGAPLTKRSLEMVKYIHEKTEGRYPIIGVGGIMTPQDAQNMLDAGASLVQVYTGFIYNGPSFVKRICKFLENVS